MNKFSKLSAAVLTMLLAVAVLFTSCKKNFDEPPVQSDPAIVPNLTIQDLKAMHPGNGAFTAITTDIIITGVVVADDRSGNLYKQIFIQDSTGGLQIMLDAASLYGTYPVGRRVYIKCNGLTLSDYNNTPQLGIRAMVNGGPSLEAIPSALISKYVIGGSLNNPVVPKVVTLSQLGTNRNDPHIGTLIQLDNFEFIPSDTSKTYADTSVYRNSGDRYIKNCTSAATIDVRSSGYANFAAQKVPSGNGTILAIYTVFNSTKQLIIRDTSDVRFTGLRCGVIPGSVNLLNETFESQTVNSSVSIPGWVNAAETGGILWQARSFSNNKYANMSAFGTNQNVVTSWLVTKGINLGTYANKVLSFATIQGFTGTANSLAAPLKVLISTNYTGTGNPWAATWTDITSSAALSPGSATGFPSGFTSSGNISLNAYSGTIYIAFKYEGADPSGTATDKTSTWEVDDVKVIGY